MNKTNIYVLLISSAVALSLSGCGIYGSYKLDEKDPVNAAYVRAVEEGTDSAMFGNLDWHKVFVDPALTGLIERALEVNTDLENARLNVDIAQASLRGARLAFLPSIALAPNGSGSAFGGNRYDMSSMSWSYSLPLSVSWEVDVFGKLLNAKRTASANYRMAKAYEQATRSQIIASVAGLYYNIAAVESQLRLNRETSELWAQSVEVMKNFKLAGRLTEAAVVQSEAQYIGVLAQITELESTLKQLNSSMSLLLHEEPHSWGIDHNAVLEAPAIMRAPIPMSELAARPDVRAAEYSLAAAFYTTASARAAFYPGLTISANGAFSNLLGSVVTNPGEFLVNVAGSLTMPIFARGQNISRLKVAKAQQQQALNTFHQKLLSASAEVSDAMTVYEKTLEKSAFLEMQVEKLEQSVEYTSDLLRLDGTTSYLEVLTAQQSLLAAQMSSIACRQARAAAIINLYQSLGGGR